MLSSPGHSPRHLALLPEPLSEPSPSQNLTTTRGSVSSMGPPPPKKPQKPLVVLDEDSYVAAIEKIVERDFFPDISKLRNRLEWLEAVRSGDPTAIRDAQIRIIQRRTERATPSVAGTPATGLMTPGSVVGVASSPAPSLLNHGLPPTEGEGSGNLPDTSMTLDAFLRKYTSEDNASFSEVKAKDDEKKRAKVQSRLAEYQTVDFLEGGGRGKEGEEEVRKTDGFGTSNQPVDTLTTWNYRTKNLLMYDSSNRPDAPLSQQEIDEMAKGPPKEISRKNTRFLRGSAGPSNPSPGGPGERNTANILYGTPLPGATPGIPMARASQSYDLAALRGTPVPPPSPSPSSFEEPYGFVHTPSPAPGVEFSPLMTWGELEGTPVRLEDEEEGEAELLAGARVGGAQFSIAPKPLRDETAHKMSRGAGRSLRERQQLRMGVQGGKGRTGRTFSPSPQSPGMSPLRGNLSAAAQKLVSKALKRKAEGMDVNLRASYGGTPGSSPLAGRKREASVGVRSPSASPAVRQQGGLRGGVASSPVGWK